MGKVINFSDEVDKRLNQKLKKKYDPSDPDAFVKLVNIIQEQKKTKKKQRNNYE